MKSASLEGVSLLQDAVADGAPGARRGLRCRLDRMLGIMNSAAHLLAAFWLFAIAFVICADVLSRALLNAPFAGTAEVVANSVVSIVFLMLPSAVRSGGMLRAEVLDMRLPPRLRRLLHGAGYILGALLFIAVAFSAWPAMVEAWQISEYAGNESTIKIPLAPIRTLLVVMSAMAAINFLLMAVESFGHAATGARHG